MRLGIFRGRRDSRIEAAGRREEGNSTRSPATGEGGLPEKVFGISVALVTESHERGAGRCVDRLRRVEFPGDRSLVVAGRSEQQRWHPDLQPVLNSPCFP